MMADSAPVVVAFGRDYWLRRCEGFRVRAGEGHLGFVERVELDLKGERPLYLSVRAGRIVVLVVPMSEIEEIVPEQELVLLRSSSQRLVPEFELDGSGLGRVA